MSFESALATLIVHSDVETQRLQVAVGTCVRDALDTTAIRVRAACGGTGSCGACVIKYLSGAVNPATLAEYQKLSATEREAGIRLACQIRVLGDAELLLEHPAHVSSWKSIAPEDLIPVEGQLPELQHAVYGLAVDLGTTHIRISLWNRKSGQRIANRSGFNPQSVFGADVLNRLNASLLSDNRSQEMAQLARQAVLEALRDILARDIGEVSPMLKEIGSVIITGNTAMLALLSLNGADQLLNPDNWQQPIDCLPLAHGTWQSEWNLPNAEIKLAPALAGFVGSDLTADIIGTRLTEDSGASLLVDIGTNTELALWDGHRLLVTSVPGGPAFEGVGIRNGMSAEQGAIYRVERMNDGHSLQLSTLGTATARGYCGSGLIDMIAILLETGTLKPSGRFSQNPGPDGFIAETGNPKTAVTPGDVDALQRAKAAIATAMKTLLTSCGLTWESIERLCVCGTFGRHLNIRHAQAIGLLPLLDNEKIELYANATLAGCERALLNDGISLFEHYAALTQVINLSYVPGYDDLYINNLRLRPIIMDTDLTFKAHPRNT
jgi:uncharacterized 2Fe-2S/4Fe-4S cluster protein (DUF4445 family)